MILFIALLILLIMGMPVGFAIGISCMIFLYVSGGTLSPSIIAQKMITGLDSFPLLALPFFILAGDIMMYGTTPRLMRFANSILGFIKGGMAGVAVTACAFFGAISGSGVATVASVGSIVQPEMVKQGYGKGFTASLIAGAGVLGMVIPPSMPMVVFGVSAGVSIGELFLAGIIPGLLVALFLLIYGILISRKRNYGNQNTNFEIKEVAASSKSAILPLFLPIIILGGVMTGVFTPTESAVVAVVYALILALFVYKELRGKELVKVIKRSAVVSAMVLFIISAATPFGWLMATERIPEMMADALMGITSNQIILLVMISVLLLILGTFMETVAVIIIMTPILVPIAAQAGIDPIHFGVLMMVNLAIGGVTPPLAVGLFTSAKIVGIKIENTFPEVLHVVGIMIFAYLVILFLPQLSLSIPAMFD